MTGDDEALIRCFQATFPELAVEQLPGATAATVADWDSLHTLILIAVLEETFALRIPPEDYPALRSYASVRAYLLAARVL
jgi:acyl carrier protein